AKSGITGTKARAGKRGQGDWFRKVPAPFCFDVVLATNTSARTDTACSSLYHRYRADWCSIIRTTTVASCQNAAREYSRENKHDHMLFHRHLLSVNVTHRQHHVCPPCVETFPLLVERAHASS